MADIYSKIWQTQLSRLSGLYSGGFGKTKPLRLRIRLTNKCNLYCKFCIRNTFSKDRLSVDELSEKDLLKLIDDFSALGGKFVEITGDGEPTIRLKTLLAVMSRIKKNNLFGELTTNGTLFTEDSIRKIVEMQWDMIRFSIDGGRRTHDYLRGKKGTFNKAIKNMNLFMKTKKVYNEEKPSIGINFVLTNKNYNELGEVIEIMNLTGAKFLWATPMIVQYDSAKKLLLGKNEERALTKNLEKSISLSKEYGIETNFGDLYNLYKLLSDNSTESSVISIGTKKIKCFMPWTDMIIAEDGKVGPCFAFYFGNLNIKNRALRQVWRDKHFDELRKSIIKNNLCNFCRDCKQWWGPKEAMQMKKYLKSNES